jgi:hypothetical protein
MPRTPGQRKDWLAANLRNRRRYEVRRACPDSTECDWIWMCALRSRGAWQPRLDNQGGGVFFQDPVCLCATDQDSGHEYQRPSNAYLDGGENEAHVEVAVADKGDGQQLDAYDGEG